MSVNDLTPKDAQYREGISPDILVELLDMRVSKRCGWPEISAYYYELTGQSIEEGTLRQLLREALIQSVPEQVSYEISQTLRQIWKSAGADKPVFDAVYAKVKEWRLLNEELKAAALQGGGGEISPESLQQVDRLKNDLTGLFFGLTANGEDFSDSGAVLDQLTAQARSVNQLDGSSRNLTLSEITEYTKGIIAESQAKLEEIHQRHKEEGRGFYRHIPEASDDLLEEE